MVTIMMSIELIDDLVLDLCFAEHYIAKRSQYALDDPYSSGRGML
jgi:hypothetical protein